MKGGAHEKETKDIEAFLVRKGALVRKDPLGLTHDCWLAIVIGKEQSVLLAPASKITFRC
jgi:hypothetical protein